MRSIAPRTGAPEETFAEDQPQFKPITVGLYHHFNPEGQAILMRFTLSDEERLKIASGEDVYVFQPLPDVGMTPIHVQVGSKGFEVTDGNAEGVK